MSHATADAGDAANAGANAGADGDHDSDAAIPPRRQPPERPSTSAIEWAENIVLQYRSLRAHQMRFIARAVRFERRRPRASVRLNPTGSDYDDVRWFLPGEERVVFRAFHHALENTLPPMREWDSDAAVPMPMPVLLQPHVEVEVQVEVQDPVVPSMLPPPSQVEDGEAARQVPKEPASTIPKGPTPKVSTPKVSAPKVSTPKVSTPKVSTPKVSAPKVSTPMTSTPKRARQPGGALSPPAPPQKMRKQVNRMALRKAKSVPVAEENIMVLNENKRLDAERPRQHDDQNGCG
ncbi:hypothetical protein BZA05DRAFT_38334 [Tricharina praecox]|uniref:uncharacterized protein n=1 Tax=Tricharina praecox TaxID=43433 RepID=UPI0022211A41|nr:uncharacterized protein BZA05DRAFT_38334 [Tricharina praecox]KAI5852192.1 hypothetical protein BZA05DRAFT_38334 [Tricharina praecox]